MGLVSAGVVLVVFVFVVVVVVVLGKGRSGRECGDVNVPGCFGRVWRVMTTE